MFSKEKYKELYEILDDKNKVILYLLSKNKISAEALCSLKISDVNEKGIGGVELPKREQIALAKYLKAAKTITSIDSSLFTARGNELTVPKLKIIFARMCKKASVTLDDVDIKLSEKKQEIDESNVDMHTILEIIKEKVNR